MARTKSVPRQVVPATAATPTTTAPVRTAPATSTPTTTAAAAAPPPSLSPPAPANVLSELLVGAALLAYPIVTVGITSVLASDPTQCMLYSLPVVIGIELAAVLSARSSSASAVAGAKGAAAAALGKKKKAAHSSRISTTITSLILTALLTPLLHAILILFGAPVTVDILATYLLACHLGALSLFPLLCTTGSISLDVWTRILALQHPRSPTYAGAVGCVLGAWLGAVPIPLDWDREWQRWPVTIAVGAYAGSAIGRVAGALCSGEKRAKTA
ncbi:GPI biosynthesis protein family Pig-F-domain-containing protein [Limtongia smithiae]|uniref:GPI biosynthesis protein family Pig-F-domain-containing protein n=1 Tax=Limtongia smithiae TaxID=1125753 RepID=UPI0034CF63EC